MRRPAQGKPRQRLGLGLVLGLVVAVALFFGLARESRPALLVHFALQRAFGGSVRVVEIDGVGSFRMFLDPDSRAITPIILEEGIWEPAETALVVDSLRPGDVAVDVGANVGYYTLLAAKLVGERGRVYGFEPDPVNFAFLERNVRLNGFDNVVLEPMAASNQNGTATLYFHDDLRGDSRLYDGKKSVLETFLGVDRSRESVEVQTVRLDDYFSGREEELHFVKIDTQGAEAVIVEGMLSIARASQELVIAIEFVPELIREFGADPAALVANLVGLDLRFYEIRRAGPQPSEPDELLARFDTGTGTNLFLVRRGAGRDPERPGAQQDGGSG